MRIGQRALVGALAALSLTPTGARAAETVVIFSAGSLRAVVTDLARAVEASYGISVKPTFGSSGLLRERIEKGEKPDLFLSADVGSPRKLEAATRTQVPVIVFARNRMCFLSAADVELTEANVVDRLLAPGTRLRTSTPIADPAGDYAWAIFDRIESLRAGAGAALKAKAQAFVAPGAPPPTAPPGATPSNPVAALFRAHEVDVAISYCSGVAGLRKELPALRVLPAPAALDPQPLDGLALLTASPAAERVALYLLSEAGQQLVAKAGLVPLVAGNGPAP